ncbi:uncharacterized protein A1O5_03337 [Cladophialophora psammophila CBS 110553]|uniref:AMP-activated protein kinase glycogen-binding domain-containing protein n=1 Tax=Cladophialophora psammophila CBS 110553 TaxID=1182543 RepID=W9X9G2_9EURO|nr:uncharacterized protein A1O5_03337 [Cladophialophora psammophila CBS 110553]EXJ73576.1 hypothetical protein A1O5_03337 [Cladophialophora psammophila CBS 110553]
MGSFVFKWPHPEANDVHVTGTFDDWGKSVKLDKVGDIWEKEVDLPEADKKIFYKFVVNDQWIIDPDAPQEDDGRGNVNNVLLPEHIKPKPSMVPEAVTMSSAAPESTTAAMAGQVPLEPKKEATEVTPASESHLNKEPTGSSVPGTFPETPAKEPDSYGVSPLPPTSGAGNPIDLPAGEKVPPPGEVTANTIESAVTTSKEDYESAGSGIPIIGGALSALGLAGAAAKKEKLIPESSLPMGPDAGKSLDAGPFINSAGASSTTAEMAGKVPLEERKPATEIEPGAQATTSTVPEVVKESIAEAHTEPEATTSAEAVKEKAEVEQELLKRVPGTDEAGEPAPMIAAATAETAPSPTPGPNNGIVPGESSTAAAAVADGTDGTAEPIEAAKHPVEAEKTEGDTTEYAPLHAAGAAPGVSESAAAAVSDGAEDLAEEPAVQMMNKNEAEAAAPPAAEATTTTEAPKAEAPTTAAPESKEEATPAAPTSATETPTKKAETTPTSTPSSAATKEKKKKHRVSSFFKKIFD